MLVPALFYGLTLSTVVPEPTSGTLIYFGEPLLFQWVAQLVIGPVADGSTINMHPVVWGCWFGMLATALNLLPFGQLDGGHIVYAVFGERIAKIVSAATALGLAAMIGLSITWIVPTVMLLAMWRWIGLRHPVPLNPYEPLSNGRRAFALIALDRARSSASRRRRSGSKIWSHLEVKVRRSRSKVQGSTFKVHGSP